MKRGLSVFTRQFVGTIAKKSTLSALSGGICQTKVNSVSLLRFPQYSFANSSQSGYELMKKMNLIEKDFQEAAKEKRYDDCLRLLQEKIDMKKASPNTSLLNDYRMLGELNQHVGNANNALNAFEEALKLSIKLDSKEIQALSLSDIAGIHYLSENYPQAVGYFEESIALLKSVKQPNDPIIAMGLLNLGESLVKAQDGNKAIQVYEEAKVIYNNNLADTSLDENLVLELNRNKGLVCDALGSLKLQIGSFQESLEELQTALGIFGSQFGGEDPILVGTLTNLAILYQSFKKEEDALKIYKRALRIVDLNKAKVQLHEQLSLLLGCAKALNNLGRFREAVEMFERLEEETKTIQQNNESLLPMVKGHKGYLLIQLEEFDKAKQEILEGLLILKNTPMNLNKAILYTQLAHISLHKEQQYQLALDLATESFHFINSCRKDDPNCGDCLRIMGLSNLKLGNKEQAKKYLTQSLDVLMKSVERAQDAEKVKNELQDIS